MRHNIKTLLAEVDELPNPERSLMTRNERELVKLCLRLATPLRDITAPRSMETAPKDSTMIQLLIDTSGCVEDGHPLTDDTRFWTIGFNSLKDTGDDVWHFVGWSWTQDCFMDCFSPENGVILGWMPFGATIQPENKEHTS